MNTHHCSHGECRNLYGNYTCLCDPGYTGRYCENGKNSPHIALCCAHSSKFFHRTVTNCSALFVTVPNCSSLFVTVRHCSILCVTVRHCSLLFRCLKTSTTVSELFFTNALHNLTGIGTGASLPSHIVTKNLSASDCLQRLIRRKPTTAEVTKKPSVRYYDV